VDVLLAAGASPRAASIQSGALVDADAAGVASHGVMRLPRLVRRIRGGLADPRTTGSARWTAEARLSVDGERGLGPVVAMNAIEQLKERLPRTGVAVAGISNSNHLGRLAWYAEQVAADGHVLIATTTSEALVHPWGGRVAMLGTNPLAIGVPSAPHPLVLDMATGIVSMGLVHDHAARGEPLQQGWALDAEGTPTVDADRAVNGAIAPFGGAKGYGLGLALEVLVTALTGSALGTDVHGTLDHERVCNKGDVFVLLSAESSAFPAIAGYLDQIRAVAPIHPSAPVRVPGDRSVVRRQDSQEHGIQLPERLSAELHDLAGLGGSR
jgi:LDH2 family malate/lactate/ureidoglycolate dehydrogenase